MFTCITIQSTRIKTLVQSDHQIIRNIELKKVEFFSKFSFSKDLLYILCTNSNQNSLDVRLYTRLAIPGEVGPSVHNVMLHTNLVLLQGRKIIILNL